MPIGKALIPIALLAAVTAGAGHFFPPARLFAEKVVGRSPVCPLSSAMQAADNLKLQTRYKDEILAASKLIATDPAGYHLFQTPYGRFWVPAGDDYVLPWNLAEQKREIYGTGQQAVQRGDVVLDCGAAVGDFTRLALNHGAKLVVAFEPAPENIESFRRNFQAEIASGRVILVPKGVWDKEDILVLKRDASNSAADSFLLLKDGSRGVQAPLTTIDKAVGELKLERVDYVKMDIEGAETRALAGAQATLAKYHPRLSIAAEHLPTDEVEIPAAVRKAWSGYSLTCGPCVESKDGRVRPDVLYFR